MTGWRAWYLTCYCLATALRAAGTGTAATSAQASWASVFNGFQWFFLIERPSLAVWTVKWHNPMNCCCVCSLFQQERFFKTHVLKTPVCLLCYQQRSVNPLLTTQTGDREFLQTQRAAAPADPLGREKCGFAFWLRTRQRRNPNFPADCLERRPWKLSLGCVFSQFCWETLSQVFLDS